MLPNILSGELFVLAVFALVIVVMLALDLGFFNAKSHKVSNKEALSWSGVWVLLALLFGAFIYWQLGKTKATEYVTAYLIEEALSVDNLFVFILVFNFFRVPAPHQHKVLFWGILGAVVFRAIFIFSGVWLINLTYLPVFQVAGHPVQFNVVLTLFGLFLVYAGIQSLQGDDGEEKDFSENVGIRIIKWMFPVYERFDGDKFFTIQNGKRMATLLLMVVGVIEVTDLLFAVDSIPAIFSVSKDPLILYTSNIFAILGLRTLYFLLANTYTMFRYLKYALAFILTFIGLKMVLSAFIHISSGLSLGLVGGALLLAVIASLLKKQEAENKGF
jgi:tellurite resistance protein TerC